MSETNEKVINLKWLIYRTIRAWKGVLTLAVVVALIFGLGSAVLDFIQLSDDEFMTEARQDFERQHAAWIATRERYQISLDTLEESKERQQEYNDKSIMMKIDPMRKNIASFELYVKYDYKIDPSLSVQDTDLSGRILRAYATYMTNGEMYHYIMQNLSYDIELRYFIEIFNVAVDYTNNFITVSVVHEDAQACQEILQLAKTGIESRTESIADLIDVHTISVPNQAAFETIDLDLKDEQEDNIQRVTDIDRTIQEVNLARLAWERGFDDEGEEIKGGGPEPEFEYTALNAVKGGVRMTIIGGVATAVVLFLFIAVTTLMSGKLLNPEDIKSRYGLHIIGQLPGKRKKKQSASAINRVIAKLGGVTATAKEYDTLAVTIGYSIKSNLLVRPTLNCKTIAFVGTASAPDMEKAIAAMKISGYNIVCASNVLTDATSVAKVSVADCVVLMEKQEVTNMNDIEKELATLKVWKKPILGAVVLNVDTIG